MTFKNLPGPMLDLPPNSHANAIPAGISLSVYLNGQPHPIYDDQLGAEVPQLSLRQRLVLGRQDVAKGEPAPFRTVTFTDHRKLIIAPYSQREISRQSLDISPDSSGAYLRIGNIGNHEVPLDPSSEGRIAHQQVRTFILEDLLHQPVRLMLSSGVAIQLGVSTAAQSGEVPLPRPRMNISQSVADVAHLLRHQHMEDGYATPTYPSSADVERILGAVSQVLEKAANAPDFFTTAAENVCKLGKFDACSYLGLDYFANQWLCEASWPGVENTDAHTPHFDSQALEYIWTNRQTWSTPPPEPGAAPSDERVVVTPVLSNDSVVGALYASKHKRKIGEEDALADCDVKFVEVIRDCLTVGLERLEKEQQAAKQQVCLAQFFPPGIADRILSDESLLETREENISVLFCDIRGFSSISAAIGAKRTLEWLRDVLGELSESVIRHDGVLLEYVGDELVAMWGAPDLQLDHPDLACRAAIDMVGKLQRLNEAWADRIPEELLPFGLTIGINSGDCVVGKKGTDYKYMWGPLGPTMNLASRVQGATKQYCPRQESMDRDESGTIYLPPTILITEATRQGVAADLPTRFLGSIRVVNIPDPVRVYELAADMPANWNQLRMNYETAYRQFEQRNFLEALNTLDMISRIPEFANDGPSRCLRDRALELLQNPKRVSPEHPVWHLDQK